MTFKDYVIPSPSKEILKLRKMDDHLRRYSAQYM